MRPAPGSTSSSWPFSSFSVTWPSRTSRKSPRGPPLQLMSNRMSRDSPLIPCAKSSRCRVVSTSVLVSVAWTVVRLPRGSPSSATHWPEPTTSNDASFASSRSDSRPFSIFRRLTSTAPRFRSPSAKSLAVRVIGGNLRGSTSRAVGSASSSPGRCMRSISITMLRSEPKS